MLVSPGALYRGTKGTDVITARAIILLTSALLSLPVAVAAQTPG